MHYVVVSFGCRPQRLWAVSTVCEVSRHLTSPTLAVLFFWARRMRAMEAHTDASAEGSKARIASSNTRVKSNIRRHPATTGPKTKSSFNAQLEAILRRPASVGRDT